MSDSLDVEDRSSGESIHVNKKRRLGRTSSVDVLPTLDAHPSSPKDKLLKDFLLTRSLRSRSNSSFGYSNSNAMTMTHEGGSGGDSFAGRTSTLPLSIAAVPYEDVVDPFLLDCCATHTCLQTAEYQQLFSQETMRRFQIETMSESMLSIRYKRMHTAIGTVMNQKLRIAVSSIAPTPILGIFSLTAFNPHDVVTSYGGIPRTEHDLKGRPFSHHTHARRIPNTGQCMDGKPFSDLIKHVYHTAHELQFVAPQFYCKVSRGTDDGDHDHDHDSSKDMSDRNNRSEKQPNLESTTTVDIANDDKAASPPTSFMGDQDQDVHEDQQQHDHALVGPPIASSSHIASQPPVGTTHTDPHHHDSDEVHLPRLPYASMASPTTTPTVMTTMMSDADDRNPTVSTECTPPQQQVPSGEITATTSGATETTSGVMESMKTEVTGPDIVDKDTGGEVHEVQPKIESESEQYSTQSKTKEKGGIDKGWHHDFDEILSIYQCQCNKHSKDQCLQRNCMCEQKRQWLYEKYSTPLDESLFYITDDDDDDDACSSSNTAAVPATAVTPQDGDTPQHDEMNTALCGSTTEDRRMQQHPTKSDAPLRDQSPEVDEKDDDRDITTAAMMKDRHHDKLSPSPATTTPLAALSEVLPTGKQSTVKQSAKQQKKQRRTSTSPAVTNNTVDLGFTPHPTMEVLVDFNPDTDTLLEYLDQDDVSTLSPTPATPLCRPSPPPVHDDNEDAAAMVVRPSAITTTRSVDSRIPITRAQLTFLQEQRRVKQRYLSALPLCFWHEYHQPIAERTSVYPTVLPYNVFFSYHPLVEVDHTVPLYDAQAVLDDYKISPPHGDDVMNDIGDLTQLNKPGANSSDSRALTATTTTVTSTATTTTTKSRTRRSVEYTDGYQFDRKTETSIFANDFAPPKRVWKRNRKTAGAAKAEAEATPVNTTTKQPHQQQEEEGADQEKTDGVPDQKHHSDDQHGQTTSPKNNKKPSMGEKQDNMSMDDHDNNNGNTHHHAVSTLPSTSSTPTTETTDTDSLPSRANDGDANPATATGRSRGKKHPPVGKTVKKNQNRMPPRASARSSTTPASTMTTPTTATAQPLEARESEQGTHVDKEDGMNDDNTTSEGNLSRLPSSSPSVKLQEIASTEPVATTPTDDAEPTPTEAPRRRRPTLTAEERYHKRLEAAFARAAAKQSRMDQKQHQSPPQPQPQRHENDKHQQTEDSHDSQPPEHQTEHQEHHQEESQTEPTPVAPPVTATRTRRQRSSLENTIQIEKQPQQPQRRSRAKSTRLSQKSSSSPQQLMPETATPPDGVEGSQTPPLIGVQTSQRRRTRSTTHGELQTTALPSSAAHKQSSSPQQEQVMGDGDGDGDGVDVNTNVETQAHASASASAPAPVPASTSAVSTVKPKQQQRKKQRNNRSNTSQKQNDKKIGDSDSTTQQQSPSQEQPTPMLSREELRQRRIEEKRHRQLEAVFERAQRKYQAMQQQKQQQQQQHKEQGENEQQKQQDDLPPAASPPHSSITTSTTTDEQTSDANTAHTSSNTRRRSLRNKGPLPAPPTFPCVSEIPPILAPTAVPPSPSPHIQSHHHTTRNNNTTSIGMDDIRGTRGTETAQDHHHHHPLFPPRLLRILRHSHGILLPAIRFANEEGTHVAPADLESYLRCDGVGYMSNTSSKDRLNVKIDHCRTDRNDVIPPTLYLVASKPIACHDEILSPYNNIDSKRSI